MADALTDAELIDRLKAEREHGSATAAARALGVNGASMRATLALAKARGLTADSMVVDPLGKAKVAVARLEAEVKGLQRAALTAEQVREEIYGLSSLQPEPPKWLLPPSGRLKTPGVPVTLWSDWHWGEVVDRQQVGGANQYDRPTAEGRVKRLVEKIESLSFGHMVNPRYPGIVVCLGGDMITGGIHEELVETNWGTTQEQFLEVEESLIWALTKMADRFGKVLVPCVVGNHGRDTQKSRMKGRVFHSFEWNLYQHLERWFRTDKRFRFLVPNEADVWFKVYNHRFLLTHGDSLGVKGGDGIIGAIGPIARGTFKVGRSEAQIGRDFDTLLMGHWHTYIPRGDAVPAIVNGSLIGYGEYSRLGLRVPYSRPSQALWFVHPDHGITAQWQVFVGEKPAANQIVAETWATWRKK